MNRASLTSLAVSAEPQHQLLRFLAVGAANTLLGYALYALGLFAGLPFQLASLAALCAGIAVSFFSQGRLVFRSRLQGRFARFVAMWGLLYLVNLACIAALARLGLDYYAAGFVAIVPVTALSFLLQRQFVFAPAGDPIATALAGIKGRPLAAGLCVALALCALMRVHMLFAFEINWDEFLNLSMVHDWSRGELRSILQTAFVHLFGWLPAVSANEVDQVVAARLLVAAFAVVTSLAIFRIGRRFMSLEAALFAVLAFNAFTFVFQHGISLRTDPLATALMMSALWLAVTDRLDRGRAVGLGVLVGLAGTMTIKAVFYLPVLAAILLVRLWFDADRPALVRAALLAGGSALAAFLAVLWGHSQTLVQPDSPFAFLARTSGATLAARDHAVFHEFFWRSLVENWPFWLLLAAGLAAAGARLRERASRRDGLILLSLALPLATPIFYSETYPYYYPLMLAPAAVLVGLGFQQLLPLRRGLYAAAALAAVTLTMGIAFASSLPRGNGVQRETLAIVHHTFPEPVPYIDSVSMVSSFPKRGLFMSRWGMADYRAAGRPVMSSILHDDQPRFLLDSRGSLDPNRLDPAASQADPRGLLANDVITLQTSFLRYWGPIWVPGFRIDPGSQTRPVPVAGRYRLHSRAPVFVDGRPLPPGGTIRLSADAHAFDTTAPAELRLDLPPPPRQSPPAGLFHGF
ncbi:MAG: GtrA family protein [Allosphingosinicella sp.]